MNLPHQNALKRLEKRIWADYITPAKVSRKLRRWLDETLLYLAYRKVTSCKRIFTINKE